MQIMESVDCLVACFSTLNAQQVVRNFLLRCPQLLAAPRAQLEASLGFLDFLNLSTEEACALPLFPPVGLVSLVYQMACKVVVSTCCNLLIWGVRCADGQLP